MKTHLNKYSCQYDYEHPSKDFSYGPDCLLSLLTHNVDRYLIYQKLYLFWEFTRVKIGVSNIKVTVGCDGRQLILKTFNLL